MNTKKTFYLAQKFSGFILVEAIVAISILMLAVPAALTIASKSVFLVSYSKDQVVAVYLAQEGIEIIRNRRDQNMLQISQGSSIQWNDGFWLGTSNDCKATEKCIVDPGFGAPDSRVEKCTGCSFVLNIDASGAYSHQTGGTWAPTKFSRYVQTSDVPGGGSPNEIRVSSVVTYNSHGINKTVTTTENLTAWIQ